MKKDKQWVFRFYSDGSIRCMWRVPANGQIVYGYGKSMLGARINAVRNYIEVTDYMNRVMAQAPKPKPKKIFNLITWWKRGQ